VRVERRGLVDGAYEVLKELILDQRLAPGAHVNIDALAPELGVSQTPIREALARLEAEGLVVKQQVRGRFLVAPTLDARSFEQLYEVRLLLEPHAASLAAGAITAAELLQLQRVDRSMRAAQRGGSYREYRDFSNQDARFHEVVAAAGGNPILRDAVLRLHSHQQLARLYRGHGVDAEGGVPEHEAILAAIADGDGRRASASMRRHLEGSRRRLRALLHAAATPAGG
jgi:DNA-binding GntR family transcriptional regulator